MYTRIEISGIIEVCTGMHIGGSSQFSAIGAVDVPIVTDSFKKLPMIPGSSFKGKLRSLLAQKYNPEENDSKDKIITTPGQDCNRILRLFGAGASNENLYKARLIFSDMFIENESDLRNMDINVTEIKFENTINRLTGMSNPRQIERVVRGSEFGLRLIYNVVSENEIEKDFETLADGFKLIQYDYLGGHGSRGYGKIKIKSLSLNTVIGNLNEDLLLKLKGILEWSYLL